MMLSNFLPAYWASPYLIQRSVYSDPLPILKTGLAFNKRVVISFYILQIQVLYHTSEFANILSYPMGCLVTSLIVFFEIERFSLFWVPLHFHIHFRISLPISINKSTGNQIEIALNL